MRSISPAGRLRRWARASRERMGSPLAKRRAMRTRAAKPTQLAWTGDRGGLSRGRRSAGRCRSFGSEEDDRPGELDRDHEEESEGEASIDDVDVPEELDVGAEALAQDLQEDGRRGAPGERVAQPHVGVGDDPVEDGEPDDGGEEGAGG